ncbi:MAG: InlB B-repeat-containing protein [Clostridiales bacterium]|nr:InlB B-repeat-containing protein [Clostridiales bacterium]
MKKLISVLTAFVIFVLPLYPVYSFDISGKVYNSDIEAYSDGVFYEIETPDGGRAFTENEDFSKNYLTGYSVSEIAVSGKYLYVSKNEKLRRINLKNGKDTVLLKAEGDIDRFALSGSCVYYLSGGDVYVYNITFDKTQAVVTGKKIKNFWFDDVGSLSYISGNSDAFVLDLKTGETVKTWNDYSSLGDSILVPKGGNADDLSGQKMSLISLQEKFPDGYYWNHGRAANNPDGYTSTPCTHHPNDTGCSYGGSCGCNSFYNAIQCAGYALKCGYDVTGFRPNGGAGGWSKSTSKSSIDSIKAGDVVRYRNDGHSIYITGVDGDKVYFTDCNWGHQCKIRWEASVSKSTLKDSFTYCYVGPYDVGIFTIKLDLNGGDSCSKTSITVSVGEKYGELPVPVKAGYNFVGWFTEASGGSKVTSDTVASGGMSKTIYAHWEPKVYTIKFDATGGTGAPDDMKKKHDQSITIPTDKPSRKGYTFKCWNTKKDGSGNTYYDTFANRKFSENGDTTLYAMWTGDRHTITFNVNSPVVGVAPSTTQNSMTVYNGQLYGTLPSPTLEGWTFDGWFTSKEGGTRVLSSDTVEIFENTILYAHWSVTKYTITFDANGGQTDTPTVVYEYGSRYGTLPSVSRKGYTFLGWFTDKYAGEMIYENTPVKKIGDYSVFAHWRANSYLIEFDPCGGHCATGVIRLDFDENWGTLPVPEKDGCIFIGWYTEKVGGNKLSDNRKMSFDTDVTFYAQWLNMSYTLIFDPCGGQVSEYSRIAVSSQTLGELPSAQRQGHSFEGWFTEKEGGEKVDADTAFASSKPVTLFAHWLLTDSAYSSSQQYNITFICGESKTVSPFYEGQVIVIPDLTVPAYCTATGFNPPLPAIMPGYDFSVECIYEPIKYPVHFFSSSGNLVGVSDYTVETDVPFEPAVPSKFGYDGSWESYSFKPGSMILNAVYTPTVYTIYFCDLDGSVVDTATYTILTDGVDYIPLPPVPEKSGYTGTWDQFSLTPLGDKFVYPSYVCSAEVSIVGQKDKITLDYRSSITLYSTVDSSIEGCETHWLVNGNDVGTGNPDGSLTLKNLTGMRKVQVKLYQDDELLSQSKEEYVYVKSRFFNKLVAFFRRLFGTLPEYVQTEAGVVKRED